MSKPARNLVGGRFGLLTVVEDLGPVEVGNLGQRKRMLRCICDCGNETIVQYGSLTNGLTKSCGCQKGRQTGYRKGNEYYVDEIDGIQVAHIQSSNSDDIILVDLDIWEDLKNYTWHVTKTGYAAANYNGSFKCMHQVIILEIPEGYERDHINRNRLDNRLSNLRVVPKVINLANREYKNKTSKYTGVCWYKPTGQWLSYITVDGELINLGLFDCENDAYAVRLQAEKDYFNIAA